ncbi:MAG: MSMEG_4193 family putative phosphomutase [Caldilineaceae bacterium]|nr:MSMEG_4193 family putative phosphomutase [Caldilineaceae bacterium]
MATANTEAATETSAETAVAPTYVFLVRHGENDWVGSNRLAGRTPGVHLNAKGRDQADKLADLLQGQPIRAIYSSPMERCMETAQPLARRLEQIVEPEAGIVEIDYGAWQGGALKELSATPEWQMVQHYPSQFRFPDGETLHEAQMRAVTTINRRAQQHAGGAIALFSHGDIIRTSLAHYLGVPLDLFQRIIISTASVSVIGFFNNRPAVLAVNYLTALPNLEPKPPTTDDQKTSVTHV